MRTVVAFFLAALATITIASAPAFAQPAQPTQPAQSAQSPDDWVAVGKSDTQTIYMHRVAATIYANGERRAWVRSVFNEPQTVEGYTFNNTLTLLVFDCLQNESKIADTRFLDSLGAQVYADPNPDATFSPIAKDSLTAFVQEIVCASKPAKKAKK